MHGMEGAILIPVVILASAAILYFGLINVRDRQLRGRRGEDS